MRKPHIGKNIRLQLLYFVLVGVMCLCLFNSPEAIPRDIQDILSEMSTRASTFSRIHTKNPHINGLIFNRTLKNETEYFDLLMRPSGFFCRKLLSLGGGTSCQRVMDGDKKMCMDDSVRPPINKCLVYSFGIGEDVTFEEDMRSLFNCEMHMFDPTVNAAWLLQEDLADNIHFHSRGLSATNKLMVNVMENNKTYEYSTFDNILKDNGHLGRTIHYLKMDVEATEWEVLPYMMDHGLLDNVMQLAIEIHVDYLKKEPFSTWLPTLQKHYNTLSRLENIGFRKISYKENMNMVGFLKLPFEKEERPACGEIFYIRDPQTIRPTLD